MHVLQLAHLAFSLMLARMFRLTLTPGSLCSTMIKA